LDSDGINTYTIFIVLASFYRLIMQNAAYMQWKITDQGNW